MIVNSTQRFMISSPDIIHETIDNEAILMSLSSGWYYSFNRTGTEIWNGLVAGYNIGEIAQEITQRYDASEGQIESEVTRLVEELSAEELISPLTGEVAATAPEANTANQKRAAFVTPRLEKYTEMADLIQTDPIHDTDLMGWPTRN